MAITKERLPMLADPATYRECGVNRKWRVLRVYNNNAELVPYYDARDVQKVLDYVVGPDGWANEAMNINGKLYMSISINVEGEGWISKSDVGTETNVEAVKGEASDALKRAAVMWGVFRNLYDTDTVILKASGKTPLTAGGKPLNTPAQLSAYCNGLHSGYGHLVAIYQEVKDDPEAMKALGVLKAKLNMIQE